MLRNTNPSPYMYIFSLEDADGRQYSIVGSSPEALVTVTGEEVITHPIAGSRPRGKTVEADKALAEELLADQKERAEHLMLVDLSRNDLSKVCVAGSVDVTQFMEVERFSHIMHLVSTVVGKLAPAAKAYDVLKATFPAGTLSGAPKPRALRLLDELEPHRRGIYGGVVGYLDFAGDMDMAIAIRSALLREGRAYVQAGGGIVADSVNATEALETVNKAAAPLRAVHTAGSLRNITAESITRRRRRRGHAERQPDRSSSTSPAVPRLGPEIHAGPGHRRPGAGRLRHHHADLAHRPPRPGPARPGRQQPGRPAGAGQQGRHHGDGPGPGGPRRRPGRVHCRPDRPLDHHGASSCWPPPASSAPPRSCIADPLAAAQGSIAAATGITGSNVQVDVTVFPALAVVAGILLGLGALLIIPAGRYWKSRTKYDTAAAGASGRRVRGAGRAGGRDRQLGPAVPRRRPHLSRCRGRSRSRGR